MILISQWDTTVVHAVHVNESTLKRVSSGIKTGKRTLRHGEVRTSVDSHMLALQASTCSTVRSSHCAALRSRHRRTFLEQHVTPRKKKAHYFAEDLEIYGKTTIYLLIYLTKLSNDHTLCSHNEVKKNNVSSESKNGVSTRFGTVCLSARKTAFITTCWG